MLVNTSDPFPCCWTSKLVKPKSIRSNEFIYLFIFKNGSVKTTEYNTSQNQQFKGQPARVMLAMTGDLARFVRTQVREFHLPTPSKVLDHINYKTRKTLKLPSISRSKSPYLSARCVSFFNLICPNRTIAISKQNTGSSRNSVSEGVSFHSSIIRPWHRWSVFLQQSWPNRYLDCPTFSHNKNHRLPVSVLRSAYQLSDTLLNKVTFPKKQNRKHTRNSNGGKQRATYYLMDKRSQNHRIQRVIENENPVQQDSTKTEHHHRTHNRIKLNDATKELTDAARVDKSHSNIIR